MYLRIFLQIYEGKLTKLTEEIRKSKSLAGDFNTPLSVIDKEVGSKSVSIQMT